MAVFVDYAEVLTAQHPQYQAYVAGIKKTPPGVRLGDVLERTGGAYRIDFPIPEQLRDYIRIAAKVSSDSQLLAIAERGSAVISLEHLRGTDLNTKIVFGHQVNYTPEESKAITEKYPPNLSPKDTIEIDLHPEIS